MNLDPVIIKLPCFGIEVQLNADKSGIICSGLRKYTITQDDIDAGFGVEGLGEHTINSDDEYNHDILLAIDVVESLVLAHALSGVKIQSKQYVAGLQTTIDKIFDEYCP